jgi:histone arginine demethylase JMJD6
MGWRTRLESAKRRHRPSLKDWECDGLYEEFPAFVRSLQPASEQFRSFVRDRCPPPQDFPVLLDARTLTPQTFWDKFEATRMPCVIHNIPAGFDGAEHAGEWPATRKWSLENLEKSELRDRVFKCGEDDSGKSVKVKLKHFLRYLHANRDDSPLYVFDSNFDNDRYARSLLRDYRVPTYFRDDLFRYVSESRRPPYRWVLVGPERSGSTVHIDPLATNAWNTLLLGKKRWVLFPPHVPKAVVKGRGLIRSDEDDEAIHYFMTIIPRIKRKAAAMGNQGEYVDFACYEFTQNAGETVFVPHGWWHAVLNLTHTVGVTQNFCSPRNFDAVWLKARSGRKRMAWKWLNRLDEVYPELANRARMLNQRDNFRMKYDPVEIKRREEERRLKSQRYVV